jgi:hypothetical protein
MANPLFPTGLAPLQDSRYYDVEQEDNSLRTKADDGYVITRAKHTRAPRKTFTTGFTNMKDADKLTLQGFFDSMKGGLVFDWTDPPTGSVFTVRFAEGPLKFKYVGIGNNKQWDVSFRLEQV